MFFLKNVYIVKSNYFKITPLPRSVCFISQINIMHKYTGTVSKYPGKIGVYIACGYKCTQYFEVKNYAERSEAKNFWNLKNKHTFYVNNQSKYFPCVSKFFLVSEQNSLCFPWLEKVRTKFPVFPVPWPPCIWLLDLGQSFDFII